MSIDEENPTPETVTATAVSDDEQDHVTYVGTTQERTIVVEGLNKFASLSDVSNLFTDADVGPIDVIYRTSKTAAKVEFFHKDRAAEGLALSNTVVKGSLVVCTYMMPEGEE